jgi:hypothetical protein
MSSNMDFRSISDLNKENKNNAKKTIYVREN